MIFFFFSFGFCFGRDSVFYRGNQFTLVIFQILLCSLWNCMVLPSAVNWDVMTGNCFGGRVRKVIPVGGMGPLVSIEGLREGRDGLRRHLS